MQLVLASASPARRALLKAAGIEPSVIVSGVDEDQVNEERPEVLCLTLARLKAEAVAARMNNNDSLVLGCDSVLALDGQILGKPADAEDAVARWQKMRGRHGVLHTGHHLINTFTGRTAEATASTTVHFADLDDDEIAAYVRSGEPMSVAGAFTIDGRGGPFVERIEGDHGTVVGLSLPLLRHLLKDLDVRITDLWSTP